MGSFLNHIKLLYYGIGTNTVSKLILLFWKCSKSKVKCPQISLQEIQLKRKNGPLDAAQLWEQREWDYLPNWHQPPHSIWQITWVRLQARCLWLSGYALVSKHSNI